jgi:hypothetical protein
MQKLHKKLQRVDAPPAFGHISRMSTVIEIETAIESLALPEKREVFDFLASRLEAEAGAVTFPDLKGLLLEIPNAGSDEDFARLREVPRDVELL